MSLNAEDVKECTVCSCDLDEDREIVVRGYFGILPVAFCGTCYSCMIDMADQGHEMDTECEEVVK
tara:strand:+ start:1532 stop:1726 length:195 start_codon:yes stop_codon:yes gene_type:complete